MSSMVTLVARAVRWTDPVEQAELVAHDDFGVFGDIREILRSELN